MSHLTVRPATQDDALDLLVWRNDPLTRAMSLTTDAVAEDAHMAWFARALARPECRLLIGMQGGDKVGMVRIDGGEVSINLRPDRRGQGLALPLLKAAIAGAAGTLVAHVRPENAASIRLFERAGFQLVREDGARRYELRQA